MANDKKIKKGDLIILASLCLLCVLLFILPFFNNDKATATVTLDGETVREIDLSPSTESYTFEVNSCVIRVEENTVKFESSSCPDKLCIKSGALSKAGDIAACVPNKVVVAIKGKKSKDADMVAY